MRLLVNQNILIIIISSLLVPLINIGQPIIDASDMPNPKDTFRLKIANIGNNFNDNNTGANYFWDFRNLQATGEQVDTFISVSSTPISYQTVFNQPWDPNKATIAASQQNIGFAPPGMTITDFYNFYRETPAKFVHLGFAAKINNTPTPIKFDNPELWYKFPITYLDVDSSSSYWEINIPNYGFMSQKRKRYNYVDGYGTLITPYDTFQVIRIKSEIKIRDSINYNGIGFPREYTEYQYRWLADNIGVPVLQINISGNNRKAYFYNPWQPSSNLNNKQLINKITFGPNPTSDFIQFNIPDNKNYSYYIYDITGQKVKEGIIFNNNPIDISQLSDGFYYISINNLLHRKFVKISNR